MCVDFYWGRRCFIAPADCVEIGHCSCKVPNAFSLILQYWYTLCRRGIVAGKGKLYLKPLVGEWQIKFNRECQFLNKNNGLFNIFYYKFNLFCCFKFNSRQILINETRRVSLKSVKLLFYLP